MPLSHADRVHRQAAMRFVARMAATPMNVPSAALSSPTLAVRRGADQLKHDDIERGDLTEGPLARKAHQDKQIDVGGTPRRAYAYQGIASSRASFMSTPQVLVLELGSSTFSGRGERFCLMKFIGR